jgi:hypothetical protein
MSGRFRIVFVPAVALLVLGLPSSAEPQLAQVTDDQVRTALRLQDFSAQQLEVPAEPVDELEIDLTLDGVAHTLSLRAHSVRSEDYRLLVSGPNGELQEIEAPAPRTFRGVVTGPVAGQVAASITNGQINATLLMEDGTLWQAEPLSRVAPQADAAAHVVYRDADMLPMEGICGTDTLEVPEVPAAEGAALGGPPMNTLCRIAFDVDYEYFAIANNGSIVDTQADVEAVLNAVDMIYASQARISYILMTTLIRQVEPDPYTSFSGAGLLTEFTDEWNNNQGGIVRDVAHLFTGKDLGSVLGISWVGVICTVPNLSYALSQSRHTGNWVERVALTAHEIGHNWAAGHCDGAIDCSIMCSGAGGCSGNVSFFGSTALGQITAYRDAIGCLAMTPYFGSPYILWRHEQTRHHQSWLLDGGSVTSSVSLPSELNRNWTIVATGDFDGDLLWDVFWRNTKNGRNRIWFFNGFDVTSVVQTPRVPDQNWFVAGIGDFNGDGMHDIIWRHRVTGNNTIWLMNGATVLPGSGPTQARTKTKWEVAGVGDFDNDGMDDLLWRHKSRGKNAIWFMNGTVVLPGSGALTTLADRDWKVAGVGDFDADGMADILWRHAGNGNNTMWFMNGRTILPASGPIQAVTNTNWEVVGVGLYNSGDFNADILWHNTANGKNSVWVMVGSVIQAGGGPLPPLTDPNWWIAGTGN